MSTNITRRSVLMACVGLARGQSQGRDYSQCLPDYLARLAGEAYARRNARVAKLTTPTAIREYQRWARATFLKLTGELPKRSPLQLQVVGRFERSAYSVEKLTYESQPGFLVTANLYVPKAGRAPYPGVLLQMGHSANGKSYATYQRCAQGLVQLGYVVLAFDPQGQGERTNFPKAAGWLTRLASADDEHTTPGRQLLLLGETLTTVQLWDAVRSLDVLAADPRVDAKRLASTGQSGGGTLTMMLAAVDDRLAAAAVSCGNTENFATMPFRSPGSTDDAEQNFIGSGAVGFDRWDLLWPFAGKPLLITASAHDFAGTYSSSYQQSGHAEYARLEAAYLALGAKEQIRWYETPLPHSLSYPLRMQIYSWFERHLKGSAGAVVEEPPTMPEPDEMLWCGKSGNAVRDFGTRSFPAMIAARAEATRTPATAGDLRMLFGMGAREDAPKIEVVGREQYPAFELLSTEVRTAAEVWIPAFVLVPKRAWTKLVVILSPRGRMREWSETGLLADLAAGGIAVCVPDMRGTGDLEPRYSAGAAAYARSHQSEEDYAWASLVLGRSLLGQRVSDLVTLVKSMKGAYPKARIVLAARDAMTVPALCAASLEPSISTTYLSGHLASWRSLAISEEYTHPLANFVPGVLRATDLPQIAKSVGRRVIVAGAVDAKGNPAPRAGALYAEYREEGAWNLGVFREL